MNLKNVTKYDPTDYIESIDSSPKPRILIVDDELPVLLSFKRSLRSDFTVDVAQNGADALEMIEQNPGYRVVVSDMFMPGCDGLSLLAQIRKKAPAIIRIMLTGHASTEIAIKAVNEGEVFRFLQKPCPNYKMRETLEVAIRQSNRFPHRSQLTTKLLSTLQREFTRPLNYITDFAQYVATDVTNTQAICDYAGFIHERGRCLSSMMDQFLTLSQIDQGLMQIEKQWTKVRNIIGPVFEQSQQIAKAKEIYLKLEREEDIDEIFVDPALMLKALSALIQNGIRSGQDGSTVTVRMRFKNDKYRSFWIDVLNCPGNQTGSDFAQSFNTGEDCRVPQGGEMMMRFHLANAISTLHDGKFHLETIREDREDMMMASLQLPANSSRPST